MHCGMTHVALISSGRVCAHSCAAIIPEMDQRLGSLQQEVCSLPHQQLVSNALVGLLPIELVVVRSTLYVSYWSRGCYCTTGKIRNIVFPELCRGSSAA